MTYRAKAAQVDITPPAQVPLAGFSTRYKPFDGIASPLFISALLLQYGSRRAAIISVDTLSIGKDIQAYIQAKLPDLSHASIIVSASHTHFAPAIDQELPALGRTDEAYLTFMLSRIDALFDDLHMQEWTSCELRRASRVTGLTRKRRAHQQVVPRFLEGYLPRGVPRVLNAPDFTTTTRSPIDLVGLFAQHATTPNESPLALVWSFACHPVSSADPTHVSADFIGHVRERIATLSGNKTISIFLQGFAGDLRPDIHHWSLAPRNMVKSLLVLGPVWADGNKRMAAQWSGALTREFTSVWEALRTANALPAAGDALEARHRQIALSELQTEMPGRTVSLAMQYIRLAEKLSLFAASGEWLSDWQRHIHSEGETVLGVAYTGHLFGYLPTDEAISHGGYEVEGFRLAFGLSGKWRTRIEEQVAEHIRELMGKHRDTPQGGSGMN